MSEETKESEREKEKNNENENKNCVKAVEEKKISKIVVKALKKGKWENSIFNIIQFNLISFFAFSALYDVVLDFCFVHSHTDLSWFFHLFMIFFFNYCLVWWVQFI